MALTQSDREAGALARGRQQRRDIAKRAELTEVLVPILQGFSRDELGTELLRTAASLAKAANDAEVEITNAYERKATMETAALAQKMGRLELGESTNNTATFAVQGDRDAKVAELEARLAAMRGEQGT